MQNKTHCLTFIFIEPRQQGIFSITYGTLHIKLAMLVISVLYWPTAYVARMHLNLSSKHIGHKSFNCAQNGKNQPTVPRSYLCAAVITPNIHTLPKI